MQKFDVANGPAVFIMPHWSQQAGMEREWLDQTLDSIKKQTDPNWKILIADGNSPSQEAKDYLRQLEREFDGKFEAIFMPHSDGPGHARNVAIQQAYRAGYPFIVFLDADDLTHPRRVEIARKTFLENPAAGVVYSTFSVIDEHGQPVPHEKLSQSIVEILESHEANPPQGKDAWIQIATETGYTNLTSTTSVRTRIAYEHPFPPEKASEDYYAWLVYSASGAEFVYTPLTPTQYRIPQFTEGSASRSREGGRHGFYATKCRVDSMGFQAALKLALGRGAVSPAQADRLNVKFLIKEAETMGREQELDLAKSCYQQALEVSPDLTQAIVRELGFQDRTWVV
ncbi:MAG: glycosyltransferase family 2 protein [Thermoflexales bacterium]|nr:glycosyltransferase family 2 protein [Thermoflexales bacterium]